jgi:hypothetical protein
LTTLTVAALIASANGETVSTTIDSTAINGGANQHWPIVIPH